MLWEVIKILEKRKGTNQYWDKADQRKVYDYANKLVKLNYDDALKLLSILENEFNCPRIVAVELIDVLPVTFEELDLIIKEIDKISNSYKFTEKNIPKYVQDIIEYANFLESMEKEEREKYVLKLLDLLREYQKKARKIVQPTSKKAKEE